MMSTPVAGDAASGSWPSARSFWTSFDPIRPVPPITTIFISFPFFPTRIAPARVGYTPRLPKLFRMRYYAASLPRHGARIRRSPQGRSLAGARRPPGGALRQWAVRSHQAVPELRSGVDAEPGGRQGLASFGSVPMAALVSPGDLTRDSYG